jgi:Tol biopolymer transport system component
MFLYRVPTSLLILLITLILIALAPAGSIFSSWVSAEQEVTVFPGPPQSVAFTSNRDAGNNEIYVMDPDGSAQTRKTETTSSESRPDISPDGTEIVFASNRDGNAEIFVMDFDGNNVRQLTTTLSPISNTWPRWSPDGEWIAFQSGNATDVQIFRIRRNGSELTQVTAYPGMNVFPAWSPDGTKLAIRRDADIYLINSADGSDAVRLTMVGTNNQMASFSPDGTKIAFLSNRDGYGSVYIMNSDGSGDQINFTERPVGRTTGWSSRAPAWSPNGEFIYFTGVRSIETGNNLEQIYVKPVAGGAETRLTGIPVLGSNLEASVRRVAAPTITHVNATPDVLWPADNKMVPVAITLGVTDNSDPAPVCQITGVVSNEPDGETDWEVIGPLALDLRAQRFGRGTGRVYTITVTCTNTSELSSSATVNVSVPHDQR